MHFQNPVEHLRWSFLRKLLTDKLLTIVFIVFIKTIKKWLAAESRYVFSLKVHLRCLVGLWIRLRSLSLFSYVFFVDFDTNIFKRASETWSQYLRPDAIITKKNHHRHLLKYLPCNSTLGRYIDHIYCNKPNPHISPSVLSRGSCKICRYYYHLLHRCSRHSMIWPNCCTVAMHLAAAPPEVFLH